MKKKQSTVLALATILTLASCGGEANSKPQTSSQEVPLSSSSLSSASASSTSTSISFDDPELLSNKALASSKLDEIVNPVIAKITDDEIRTAIQNFYNAEKQYINGITDVATAKAAVSKVAQDAKEFATTTLLQLVIRKLGQYFQPIIDNLPDEALKTSVQNFYEQKMALIASAMTLDDVVSLYKTITDDTIEFIRTETERILILLKNQAIEECDAYILALIEKIPYDALKTDTRTFYNTEKVKIQNANTIEALKELVPELKKDVLDYAITETIRIGTAELDTFVTALIEKIPSETLKTDTRTFYNTEKGKLNSCTTIEGVVTALAEIKDDLVDYALTESKKVAKEELDALVQAGLSKLPNASIKAELNDFYDVEILKIMAISNLDNLKPTMETVLQETEAFIKGLVVRTAKDYLDQLLDYNLADPYQYVPAAMKPTYANNFVASPITDFTRDTAVADMNRQGFGDQWQMIVENINQMIFVTSAMNAVDAVMTTVSNAMKIYITNSTTETLAHTIDNDDCTATLSFADDLFALSVDLKGSYSIPAIGSASPTIKMALDIATMKKAIYISLNESNSIKYTMTDDEFELACTYGITIAGQSGSRTSYFETKKDEDGNRYGHIYEYTSYQGSDKIQACADFYVNDGYVSVVGNKASGMAGFTGFINELYSESTGRLLGYKVKEVLSAGGVATTYNTLWFNLWDISGINSVRVTDKTKANTSSKSTVDVYLNGSTTLFKPTYNTLVVKTSRKYDIELRNKTYYNLVDEKVVATKVEVPMMFIQDDNSSNTNYSDFSTNFLDDNGFAASVTLPAAQLAKIRSDYNTLIPIFEQNKDAMSSELIIQYLNSFNN
ncbi:MAG: hypothetical protein MJ228_02760 [Bacilli bacterium]|nr:hypothetical protein [Bacilli bacterium]